MTDYEILYEVLADCFWAGWTVGHLHCEENITARDCEENITARAAVTVPAKVSELLERLGLDLLDGYLVKKGAI